MVRQLVIAATRRFYGDRKRTSTSKERLRPLRDTARALPAMAAAVPPGAASVCYEEVGILAELLPSECCVGLCFAVCRG